MLRERAGKGNVYVCLCVCVCVRETVSHACISNRCMWQNVSG